jgi:hypothetical protein
MEGRGGWRRPSQETRAHLGMEACAHRGGTLAATHLRRSGSVELVAVSFSRATLLLT